MFVFTRQSAVILDEEKHLSLHRRRRFPTTSQANDEIKANKAALIVAPLRLDDISNWRIVIKHGSLPV